MLWNIHVFLGKMIKTNSPIVCPLCSFVIFAVLSFLCHYCSSLHKTESRQHTRVSTLFNSETVCVQKIHPIGNFFTHSQGCMILVITWLDTASEETWAQGQISRYAGWYSQLIVESAVENAHFQRCLFSVVNKRNFIPHTTSYKTLKFSTVLVYLVPCWRAGNLNWPIRIQQAGKI